MGEKLKHAMKAILATQPSKYGLWIMLSTVPLYSVQVHPLWQFAYATVFINLTRILLAVQTATLWQADAKNNAVMFEGSARLHGSALPLRGCSPFVFPVRDALVVLRGQVEFQD